MIQTSKPISRQRVRGVSLIEVLVAILVLSFGLLGVGALQSSALQNNLTSYQFTQAAVLASNLSEAMRANAAAVKAGDYSLAAGSAPPEPEVDCSANACNSAQLAQWDLAVWYAGLSETPAYSNIPAMNRGLLPGAQARVDCADAVCTDTSPRVITVLWDANRNGATDTSCNPNTVSALACFRLVHVP